MGALDSARIAAIAVGAIFTATLAVSQSKAAAAESQSPGWFLQLPSQSALASLAARAGDGIAAGCGNDTAKYCAGKTASGLQSCLTHNMAKLSGTCKTALAPMAPIVDSGGIPPCSHSPVCASALGGPETALQSVEWKQTMGYTFAYPDAVPPGGGGVASVAVDSKGNLWAFQRNVPGKPQLFEFDPNHKLIRTIGEDVIGRQDKAHGMAVDAQNNVWICDANGSTVMKLSPEGKLLMTIGVREHRGDWNEAKGQRLLWQPLDIAFAPNGDIYIGEGHANESPNDVGSADPTDTAGAARVIHLDKNGKFINQWYGNSWGQGKFSMVHGIAVDPRNGNVWLGDREQYRLVVYTGNGKFIKTIQMRNLICAVYFDPHGNLWVATGHDGQLLKIDQNGNVLGAIGNGRGTGPGQFMEATYMSMDSQGNLYAGDTSGARVTEMVAPKK